MNADRVATTVGSAAKWQHEQGSRGSESEISGLVIINLQRTQHDDIAALRIFAKASTALNMLSKELNLSNIDSAAHDAEIEHQIAGTNYVCKMPYSASDGALLPGDQPGRGFELDLREGGRVRICSGKYAGDIAVVSGRTRQGHIKLTV